MSDRNQDAIDYQKGYDAGFGGEHCPPYDLASSRPIWLFVMGYLDGVAARSAAKQRENRCSAS